MYITVCAICYSLSLPPSLPLLPQVKVLKDVLLEWKKEVDKKPPEMSVSEAYETLGLKAGVGGHEESKVRKAYFKLAQKYHPDKNPEGRVRIIQSFILLDYTYTCTVIIIIIIISFYYSLCLKQLIKPMSSCVQNQLTLKWDLMLIV